VVESHYNKFLKDIGSNVRTVRKRLGFSMEDLANEAEIEYRQLGRIERGEVSATITSFYRIAEAMKVDVHEFFLPNRTRKQK
jgi:transcriptional regulator with XRE-family HTH domain